MREPRSSVKRTDRLGPQIRDIVSRALVERASDPRLPHVVITDVRMSGDLRIATILYVALDDVVPRDELAAALERSRGFLRHAVAEAIRMRYTPDLRFHFDESVERGRRVDAILAGIAPEPAAPEPAAPEPPETAPETATEGDTTEGGR